MQIIFYNYGGKTNVLYKTLDPSTAITRTGTLRRGTSIITPSIDVQTDLATFKIELAENGMFTEINVLYLDTVKHMYNLTDIH